MANTTKELIAKSMQIFSDLEGLKSQLEEPERILSQAFDASEREMRARAITTTRMMSRTISRITPREALGPEEITELPRIDDAINEERKKLVEDGRRAIGQILKHGDDAILTPREKLGLEAIIVIAGRPAIFINNGRFSDPPDEWAMLKETRDSIEKNFKSVGRIEVPGHPDLEWAGTGFLVADDVIMTNRHVAKEFCTLGDGDWVFEPGILPRVDYAEDIGSEKPAEFEIKKIIGIHKSLDMALFQISRESSSGAELSKPLTIASTGSSIESGRKVYVLGYPAWDGRRNDPEIMNSIFKNIYGFKRLQPGEVRNVTVEQSTFAHDCATLGGNSGSCVIDLDTSQVIGLHFGGRYLVANYAVALWTLTSDPLLQQAGVNFE